MTRHKKLGQHKHLREKLRVDSQEYVVNRDLKAEAA